MRSGEDGADRGVKIALWLDGAAHLACEFCVHEDNGHARPEAVVDGSGGAQRGPLLFEEAPSSPRDAPSRARALGRFLDPPMSRIPGKGRLHLPAGLPRVAPAPGDLPLGLLVPRPDGGVAAALRSEYRLRLRLSVC